MVKQTERTIKVGLRKPVIIAIKTHSDFARVEMHGDWIDLSFCGIHPASKDSILHGKDYEVHGNEYSFKKGTGCVLNLGVSIALPEPYEAHLLPRSSLFLKHGILVGNSMGVIDNDFRGDEDIWGLVAYFTRGTTLRLGQRIAQFRVVERMCYKYEIIFTEKETETVSRGGFGHTGA